MFAKTRRCVLAPTAVTHGAEAGEPTVDGPGPGVAGRGGDEDARVGGEQERHRVRREHRRACPNRSSS